MATLYMETTQVSPEQTIADIQRVLVKYGANAILSEFKNGELSGISFRCTCYGHEIPFRLPCRWEALWTILNGRRKRTWNTAQRERWATEDQLQAKRVAWRQIYRWIEAQLALVQTKMVSVAEVFMPYMQLNTGETMYDRLVSTKFAMLTDQRNEPTRPPVADRMATKGDVR